MTETVRVCLLGDGSSDRCLLAILRRLIGDLAGRIVIESHWADLRYVAPVPQGLAERIRATANSYPCDILFIHRDAEGQGWEDRAEEIKYAARQQINSRYVCVIPVRMTEAWLLGDQAAIRQAADNPNGTAPLELPAPRSMEVDPNPKTTLRTALVVASNKKGRRLRRFQETIGERVQRVADIMTDFTSLYSLPAFARLRDDTRAALESLGLIFNPLK